MKTLDFCTQCGQRNAQGSRFCSACGQVLAAEVSAPTSQTTATQVDQADPGPVAGSLVSEVTPGQATVSRHQSGIPKAAINPLGVMILLGGAVAMGISPFLPFISAFGESASLDELREAGAGSGLMTEILVLAGGAGAVGVLRLLGILNLTFARLAGIAVGVLGLIEVAVANSRLEDAFGIVDFAEGFYILAGGCVAVVAGALIDRNR